MLYVYVYRHKYILNAYYIHKNYPVLDNCTNKREKSFSFSFVQFVLVVCLRRPCHDLFIISSAEWRVVKRHNSITLAEEINHCSQMSSSARSMSFP